MTIAPAQHELPYLDTHIPEFLNSPNQFLGADADRWRVAEGRTGKEFFAYDTVRALYREDRITPRTPQYFLDKGLQTGAIIDYLVDGNLNLTWQTNHDRLRPIMLKGFRPTRIAQARTFMSELAERLVDQLAGRDRINFVTDYSHHLAIGVVAGFIGIPFDEVDAFADATVKLRLLGQEPVWPGVPALEQALQAVHDYSEYLVEQRRKQPREDFISDLIEAKEAERADISDVEIVWHIAGVLLAGHDTTRYQLASAVRAIVEAEQWETLRADQRLIPAAVNEAMRLYPATPRQVKVAREPVTVEGIEFEPGQTVTLNISAAGRDPLAFSDPDRFDLARPAPLFDIGFGYGGHYCLGHAVAKAEMEEGLKVLTRRWRDVRIDGDVELAAGGVIAGPEVVPLRYELA
ncbi:cytochrome P450 [Nocardia elegans]|uniref:cytochrome P450 n=1 Tax=Nocardia elegans TaxID=300029 RepID=UPI00189569EA|nr:cytochrome P450 [Nocardia elegans]MBF6451127.1 cytochrome P450 [Nocardia elegans]